MPVSAELLVARAGVWGLGALAVTPGLKRELVTTLKLRAPTLPMRTTVEFSATVAPEYREYATLHVAPRVLGRTV